ncbi:FGGY family carbohydrate kinase [Micromonospora soli]|uniref:FGGY-family carbohydrate kinase n=1 Tax=Micromonospora sp. NBRC 110009 TaxID=3061627 RepID=UPI0026719DFB|nr:FGGY family carbohydrate kinase [Micromonospora sp. NBRC 110009]WKT99200.1 FGGY family carbohydrate kinase [Micromonospora sp. NBRC 110009]
MTAGQPLLAGLDVGTTHTKAGVFRADGTPVAQRKAGTPSDVEALRDTALRLLAECVAAAGTAPVALGVASMAETGSFVAADGTPVGELLHWRDRRAHRQADELRDAVGRAAFFAATGLHPSAKLPLARWIWLRRHEPELLRRASCWANAADLVVAALTGAVATSPTLAARTGVFDITAMAYSPELLDLAGLRPDQMPPAAADRVAGRVTASAAARSGLPAGTPVVVAGHDHLAAAWAAGVRAVGQVADSMGTAEAVVTPVAAPPPAPAQPTGTSVGPFVDGRSYCLISGLSSSGGLVEWLLDRFAPGTEPDRHRWFSDLVGPPGRPPTGITVQPYLQGRASPEPDPHRTLSFHGIRPEHSLADLGRAVLEGLCLQVRWMLESQATISGRQPDTVTVFGGPTANPTWMWIKAQVTPVPVVVLPGQQSAALGAAQLAGRAIGVADTPPTGRPLPRVPVSAPEWETAYRSQFLPLVRANAPDSKEEA